jgi:hypothetical protein
MCFLWRLSTPRVRSELRLVGEGSPSHDKQLNLQQMLRLLLNTVTAAALLLRIIGSIAVWEKCAGLRTASQTLMRAVFATVRALTFVTIVSTISL